MSSCDPEFIQTMQRSFVDVPASGAMESGGAYNKHAKLQATGSASALPCWERSVGRVALDHGDLTAGTSIGTRTSSELRSKDVEIEDIFIAP
jgi:hypothetical protein